MRNGVLGVIGEIVMQVLSKDDLDKKAKETRDQLLDTLEVSVWFAPLRCRIVYIVPFLKYCMEHCYQIVKKKYNPAPVSLDASSMQGFLYCDILEKKKTYLVITA